MVLAKVAEAMVKVAKAVVAWVTVAWVVVAREEARAEVATAMATVEVARAVEMEVAGMEGMVVAVARAVAEAENTKR